MRPGEPSRAHANMSCTHLRVRGNVLQCELKTLNLLHEPASGRTVQVKHTGRGQGVCLLAQALVSRTRSCRRRCLPGPPSPRGPVTTSFPPAAHPLDPEGILNRATQQTGSLRPPLADPGPQGWDVGGAAAVDGSRAAPPQVGHRADRCPQKRRTRPHRACTRVPYSSRSHPKGKHPGIRQQVKG